MKRCQKQNMYIVNKWHEMAHELCETADGNHNDVRERVHLFARFLVRTNQEEAQ